MDSDAQSRNDLGRQYADAGRYDEAAELFEASVASGDTTDAAWGLIGLGAVRFHQGRMQESEALFRRALETAPPEAAGRAAYNLGTAVYAQGRRREARELFERARSTPDAEVATDAATVVRDLTFWRIAGRAVLPFAGVLAFVAVYLPSGWPSALGFVVVALALVWLAARKSNRTRTATVGTGCIVAACGLIVIDELLPGDQTALIVAQGVLIAAGVGFFVADWVASRRRLRGSSRAAP